MMKWLWILVLLSTALIATAMLVRRGSVTAPQFQTDLNVWRSDDNSGAGQPNLGSPTETNRTPLPPTQPSTESPAILTQSAVTDDKWANQRPRPCDDRMKLDKLQAILADFKSADSSSLDAYNVLLLSECVIYEKLGVSVPPDGSPEWRQPPWKDRDDMMVGCFGHTYHLFRDEHPLLARLERLSFAGGDPRLRGTDSTILTPDEERFLNARVSLATSYLSQ